MSLALVVGSFVAMEGVSYALHRWVMHLVGMRWHASHHRPPAPGWEANDVFPLLFSVIGIVVFSLAGFGPRIDALWWVGIGVAAYGATYLFVHDVYIHHRLPVRIPRLAYLEWLRRAHRLHHVTGAEPYGMLFPVLPRSTLDHLRSDSVPPGSVEPAPVEPGHSSGRSADRAAVDVLDRRSRTREIRSRL